MSNFFSGRSNCFSELSKIHCKDPIATNFSASQPIFVKKKQANKRHFYALFWKILTTESCFFDAHTPLKTSVYWRQGALQKFLGSVSQKLISQNSTKRGPFGLAWGRISGGRGASAPFPSSKSTPDHVHDTIMSAASF